VEFKNKVKRVTTGATETISKSFRKYLSNLMENHDINEVQTTTIFGTARVLQKVLM
jgi:hypothetical protein